MATVFIAGLLAGIILGAAGTIAAALYMERRP